ncbi:MAG: lysophospholipid acyltransferase family protein [Candidatus Omnitrophota bacterium]|nr:lysophospholipid acyltransferase family protein [Candidatus Omnitrophota bacterium]
MYYFFLIGKFLSLIFPRDVCYVLANFLATLQFYISKKDRETVEYNLYPIVEDKKRIEKYAKEVFINFAYYLVDFFRYSKFDKVFLEKYVKVSGLDNLDQSLSRHKGILVVSAHLGNYELAGAVTSILGYSVYAIALPHKNRHLNKFFNKQREMVGIKIIPASLAVKGCFSLLKQGRLVAFLGDRDFFGGGLEVSMFSRSAILPRGPAFFATKSGAEIIPAFFIRENKKFYRLIFEKPILVVGEGIRIQEDIIIKYANILEQYIKRYPGQWYMFAKYWL